MFDSGKIGKPYTIYSLWVLPILVFIHICADSSFVSGSPEVYATFQVRRTGSIEFKAKEVEHCYQETWLYNKCAAVSVQTSIPAGTWPGALRNAATTPTSTQLCSVKFSFDTSPGICFLSRKTTCLRVPLVRHASFSPPLFIRLWWHRINLTYPRDRRFIPMA